MIRWVAVIVAAVAAASAPALADGNYSVRNDTGRALTCGLRQERRSAIDRFLLRSGAEWNQTSRRDGPRVLLCDSAKITQRWEMHSGRHYVLTYDREGYVVLRTAGR
jgi:hypothetical protein